MDRATWTGAYLALITMLAVATLPVCSDPAAAKEICLLFCPADVCEISYSTATHTCSCKCNTLPSNTLDAFKKQKLNSTPIPIILKDGPDGNITFLPGRSAGSADVLQDAREESQSGNLGETGQQTWEREQRERIVQGAAAANGMMRGQQGQGPR